MASDPSSTSVLSPDPLGAVSSSFKLAEWERRHVNMCSLCKTQGRPNRVHKSCYGARILHRLKYGWTLPVSHTPPSHRFDNYKSVTEHLPTVQARFQKLDNMGVFTSPVTDPTYSQPLQAVVRPRDVRKSLLTGKPPKVRVCMDASRNLNGFSKPWKFRYADTRHVTSLLSPNCYIAVIDFSNWYLTLPLARASRKFTTFCDPRDGKYRQYKYVPFGVSSAPAWASVVSGELCKMFQHAGVSRCSAYIDDVIIVSDSKQECDTQLAKVLQICEDLGVEVKDEKIQQPAQKQKYLGVMLDSSKSEISVSDEHRLALEEDLTKILACPKKCISRSFFNSLCGRMSWIAQVMCGARSYMRRMWDSLRVFGRSKRAPLPASALADLSWWLERLRDPTWRGSRIWFHDKDIPIISMKSDASGHIAWGFHLGKIQRMCPWSPQELPLSIQYKELKPVIMAAREFGHTWENAIIRAGIDNAGVVYMINSGTSTDTHCMVLLRELAELQRKFKFDVVASWVPREFNIRSDLLSRLQDIDAANVNRAEAASSPPSLRDYFRAIKSQSLMGGSQNSNPIA